MKGDLLKKKTLLALSANTLKVARQGPPLPLPETWDEQGVLQLRLAIDGEFWAFFALIYWSVATGEADCDGFYCTCMHRGRQDGLIVVFFIM